MEVIGDLDNGILVKWCRQKPDEEDTKENEWGEIRMCMGNS